MKKGWEVKKLGDLFEITSSKRVFESDWKTEGVPFYRAREIVKLAQQHFVDNELFISEDMFKRYSSKYGIPVEGDIMVTGVGTLGICYVVQKTDRFYFKDGNIIWLKKKTEMDSRFVEYAFRSDFLRKQIDDSVGATVGTFTIIKAKNTLIPVPPLPEQHRIVHLLDKAFERIATAKVNAEKNLLNARALFQSYLQGVFSQHGEGWVYAKLGDVCNKITDGTHITPTYTKDGVPFLSVKDLTKGFIDFSDTRFISSEEHAFLTRNCKPMRDDILYTKVGTTGIAKVVDVDDEFSIFVSVALLKPKHDIIFNIYLEHFLNAPFAREQAQKRTRGMANKNLVITDIKEIDIHFPKSLNEQHAIVVKLDALSIETQRLESVYQRKLAALDELKKSLLHQAFNGDL
jgi:type I restriction enzyme S subunit